MINYLVLVMDAPVLVAQGVYAKARDPILDRDGEASDGNFIVSSSCL